MIIDRKCNYVRPPAIHYCQEAGEWPDCHECEIKGKAKKGWLDILTSKCYTKVRGMVNESRNNEAQL